MSCLAQTSKASKHSSLALHRLQDIPLAFTRDTGIENQPTITAGQIDHQHYGGCGAGSMVLPHYIRGDGAVRWPSHWPFGSPPRPVVAQVDKHMINHGLRGILDCGKQTKKHPGQEICTPNWNSNSTHLWPFTTTTQEQSQSPEPPVP